MQSLKDLLREDVSFVNRLRQMGANAARITGYQREEYTHLAVAATVSGGAADVSLGILAAPARSSPTSSRC